MFIVEELLQRIRTVQHNFPSSSVTEYELVEYLGILIDNALEATPEGGKTFLTLNSTGKNIIIETLNLGPRLNDTMLKNLFKKGYSSKGKPTEANPSPNANSEILADVESTLDTGSEIAADAENTLDAEPKIAADVKNTLDTTSEMINSKDRGIGLWSLKKSIQKHHGNIIVSNKEINGLLYIKFVVEIPV